MKLRIALFASLLLLITLNAQPIIGTTLGHYSKPGAPIDIKYISNSVEKNETADINITLIPSVRSGTMSVILTFDKNLIQHSSVEKNLKFEITPQKKSYPINLKVSSTTDGLYYIRLLTKIEKGVGSKMRAFAVPVTIGKVKKANKNTQFMMKSYNGENISVSRAVETIRSENSR